MSIGVRFERRKSLSCFLMAFLASFKAIIRMNRRFWVRWPLHAVAAMAVITLGGVAISQFVDLPMIGVAVGCQVFAVATATVLGYGNLERILQRGSDAVRGMAIGAISGFQIAIFQNLLAMD